MENEYGMKEPYYSMHKKSSLHKEEILKSEFCGCFYCVSWFAPGVIDEWIDNGQTALCPWCGTDAVLPGVKDIETLKRMRKEWFDQ